MGDPTGYLDEGKGLPWITMDVGSMLAAIGGLHERARACIGSKLVSSATAPFLHYTPNGTPTHAVGLLRAALVGKDGK